MEIQNFLLNLKSGTEKTNLQLGMKGLEQNSRCLDTESPHGRLEPNDLDQIINDIGMLLKWTPESPPLSEEDLEDMFRRYKDELLRKPLDARLLSKVADCL